MGVDSLQGCRLQVQEVVLRSLNWRTLACFGFKEQLFCQVRMNGG